MPVTSDTAARKRTKKPATVEFSCSPWTTHPVDGDAADHLDAVLTELERDKRALGPVVGYDYNRSRLDAIFQVKVPADAENPVVAAADLAIALFSEALKKAGLAGQLGVSVVEGGPDELPEIPPAADIVTGAEIGRRLGVSRERARQLAGSPGFPAPVVEAGQVRAWRWSDVERWLAATGRSVKT